jgi:hypothetical protein
MGLCFDSLQVNERGSPYLKVLESVLVMHVHTCSKHCSRQQARGIYASNDLGCVWPKLHKALITLEDKDCFVCWPIKSIDSCLQEALPCSLIRWNSPNLVQTTFQSVGCLVAHEELKDENWFFFG